MVRGFNIFTFNAAGLHRDTLDLRDMVTGDLVLDPAGNPVERFAGSLANYNNAAFLITAYSVDYDALSDIQDRWHNTFSVFPASLGNRLELDGPYDARAAIVQSGAILGALLGNLPAEAFTAAVFFHTEILSHLMQTVAYGMLCEEDMSGELIVDALGFEQYNW